MAENTVPTPAPAGGEVAAREQTRSEEVVVPPPCDIYEDDQGLVVVADLPGVAPDALDVRVEQGVLAIRGQARHIASGTPLYREHDLTGFFRQFRLPEEIDTESIQAELRNGVLTLRLARAAPAQPRRIEVQSS